MKVGYFGGNPPTSDFISIEEEKSEKVKPNIGSEKLLLTVIWSSCGVELIDFLSRKEKSNRDYFEENLIPKLVSKIKKRRPKRGTNGVMLHLDNVVFSKYRGAKKFLRYFLMSIY